MYKPFGTIRMGLSPILLLFAMFLSSKPSAAASNKQSLQPFSTVHLSVPFHVKISPGKGYSFSISADQQVLKAVSVTVSKSVLYVATRGDFLSQQPIVATVFLPAGSLQQVLIQSPSTLVVVDTGFSVPALAANVAGTSTLYFKNLVARQVSVTSTGTSSTFLSGSLGAISLKGSGVSNFYLQGKADSLDLQLSGVSTTASAISSDGLKITGNVAFPGGVSYEHGTCSLSEGAGKRRSLSQAKTCERLSSVNIPKPDLSFTCGIDVKGSSLGNDGRGELGSCDIAVGAAGGAIVDKSDDNDSGCSGSIIQAQGIDCQSSAKRNMV